MKSDTQRRSSTIAAKTTKNKTLTKSVPSRQAKTSSIETAQEITFAVHQPNAEQVFLSGGFNGWSTDATPLTKRANRDWQATVKLPPGRHEYKFVVDGKWVIDPRAAHLTPNGFGTLNSVIEVKA